MKLLVDVWPYLSSALVLALAMVASAHAILHKRDATATLGWVGVIWMVPVAGGNAFELRMADARAGNFDVTEGFALVAEASTARIAGSVVITKAFRLNAPIPVPQVFDPPLVIRFLHQR